MENVWNRKKGELEDVHAYKENALIFIHRNPAASIIMSKIATHPVFSSLMALPDYTRFSKKKIFDFIARNKLDEGEFEKPAGEYASFSEFFDRRLKPGARPIDIEDNAFISPADGVLTVYNDISGIPSFTIKEQRFTLQSLIRDDNLSEQFRDGSLALIYLSPTDYHRFHFPCDCTLEEERRLGIKLFSVNPIAMEYGFRPFDVNVRTISLLNNDKTGRFLMIEVGATYVGRIVQTSPGMGKKSKGEEKGFFGLGGSSIVLVFRKGSVRFDEDILKMASKSISSRVRMGEKIGSI